MFVYFSMFTGCGGTDRGFAEAGGVSAGGIEYRAAAADIHDRNFDIPVWRADILQIDRIPKDLDIVAVSPPCPSFSQANPNAGETDNDLKLADRIAYLLTESKPRAIAIENVRAYANPKYKSLRIILDALANAGYQIEQSIENCANYGTPSTRERLIVRASRDPIRPLVRTHQAPSSQLSLFPLPNWITWYEAIEDRISQLPRSNLTQRQKLAIAQRLGNLPLLVDGAANNYGATITTRPANLPAHTIVATIDKHPIRLLVDTVRNRPGQGCTVLAESPANTITAEHGKRVGTRSRILIERLGYFKKSPKILTADRSASTIRAHQHIDDEGCYRVAYNVLLDNYDCYAADIGCLAAWQGFPPDWDWGDNRGEAGRAIGNAVPPPLARAVALSLI